MMLAIILISIQFQNRACIAKLRSTEDCVAKSMAPRSGACLSGGVKRRSEAPQRRMDKEKIMMEVERAPCMAAVHHVDLVYLDVVLGSFISGFWLMITCIK